jgi:hypothetical protein
MRENPVHPCALAAARGAATARVWVRAFLPMNQATVP